MHRAGSACSEQMSLFDRTNSRLQSAKTLKQVRKPRICMPSGRNFKKKTFLCGHYEGQDVLREIDDVNLVCLEPGRDYDWVYRWKQIFRVAGIEPLPAMAVREQHLKQLAEIALGPIEKQGRRSGVSMRTRLRFRTSTDIEDF
jgi:hypothetical protein